jgi:tetratricopeptide (TPR) repeat protein
LKLEPRHFGALSGRGLVFIKLRDLDRALSAFEEVLEVDPQRMGARANIAAIRKLLGQREIRCNSLPPLGGERKSSCVQTLLYTTPRVCHGSDTLTCGPSVNATLTVTVDPELPFACDPTAGRYYDICALQEHLGHSDVEATMMYSHVLKRGLSGIRSATDWP